MEPCYSKFGRQALSDRSRVLQRAFFNSEGKLPRSCQANVLHLRTKQNDNPSISGEFMHKDLIPNNVRLEDSVLSLEGEDKRLFLDFVRKVLQWLPEDRKTAKELLKDPWLVQ